MKKGSFGKLTVTAVNHICASTGGRFIEKDRVRRVLMLLLLAVVIGWGHGKAVGVGALLGISVEFMVSRCQREESSRREEWDVSQ